MKNTLLVVALIAVAVSALVAKSYYGEPETRQVNCIHLGQLLVVGKLVSAKDGFVTVEDPEGRTLTTNADCIIFKP